jgi:membrane fusion protein (multidrug efflux system)
MSTITSRVIGSAGSKEKVKRLLEERGFDAAFKYDEIAEVSLAPESRTKHIPSAQTLPDNIQEVVPREKGRVILWIGLVAVLLIAAAAAYVIHASSFEETDNAFIEADVHPISARVPGTVIEVLVGDNQQVVKGQVLARLDAPDFDVKLSVAAADLQQAEAQVPQAEAALAQARAQVRQSESQIQSAAAQMTRAALDFQRTETLSRNAVGAISIQDHEATRAAFDSATSFRDAAVAARDVASSGVLAAEANKSVAEVRVLRAQTLVEEAQLQLSYTSLIAPASGRIGKKTVETGQQVQPGQALMAVVSEDKWIVANFKENQLSTMKPGQAVEISIDAIKGRHFTGRVESIAPGTGAKFALLPPDNATGNFTKIVQRVPVKILFDANTIRGFEQRIAPGLSANAEVRVKDSQK